MRYLLTGILALTGILSVSLAYLLYDNNRHVAMPSAKQLEITRDAAVRWLTANREDALKSPNPVLWHMVQKAANLSGDPRLESLFAEYTERYLDSIPNNVWRPLFFPHTWVPVRFSTIAELPYYNHHLIYAITCDEELGKVPSIVAQNDPSLCNLRLRSPACRTHQMVGLLLMKRSRCGDQQQLDKAIASLQQRIRTQLTWDTRIVDVFMQRVLVLVESGGGELVKPVWVQRLIEAQQPDGGWANFMPLLPIGDGRYLGTRKYLGLEINLPVSSFHMTAQGILLFTLLTAG